MDTPTINLKEVAIEAINNLSDTSSMEEIMYQLTLVSKIKEGLEQANNGLTISTAELKQKVKSWQQQ